MQEWKKELCREQPETIQELGKGTYIQRRKSLRMKEKTGTEKLIRVIHVSTGFLQKKNIFQPWSRKIAIKIC